MVPDPSSTHEHVVVQQDNGELQEDVVSTRAVEGGWLDSELKDSFPASDPLPHWPGPPRPLDDADRARRRPLQRRAADEVPERAEPSDAVPRTLPRD